MSKPELGDVFSAALAAQVGLDLQVLEQALAKVARRKGQSPAHGEEYTRAEVEALSVWMGLTLAARERETRAEKSERHKAAWRSGDRREWGGARRLRDPRRGWRNFSAR